MTTPFRPDPGPLIVTGLPGADLLPVALALHRAGVDLGDDFGDYHAPSFQAVGVSDLHDRLLGAPRKALFELPDPPDLPADGREAREAMLRVSGEGAPWGWVESRSSLLVGTWDAAFPHARWIVVLSDPAKAARDGLYDRALVRRLGLPARRALRGLRLWSCAAAGVAGLVERSPDSCLVLDPWSDLSTEGADLLVDFLERLGIRTAPGDVVEAFRRHAPDVRPAPWLRRLARLHLPSRRLVKRLERHRRESLPEARTRPSAPDGGSKAPGSVSVAIVGAGPRYSQTFVDGLARGLPCRVVSVTDTGDRFRAAGVELRNRPERAVEALLREFGVFGTRIRDRSLARFLRRSRIDAVLAQFGPHAVAALPGCRRAGVPLVAHFRGYDAHREGVLEHYGDGYAEVFEHAAAIVTSSRSIAMRLRDMGAPAERIVSTPSGADEWSFPPVDPATNPPTFIAVGRFVEKKGPFLTLLAFARVAEAEPAARLVMIGDGVLQGPSVQLARALGLEDRVEFHGARRPWEVAERFRRARAFVQHSLVALDGDSEGTPVALLEASVSGLPVVATRHAGIADAVVDGETGYLVDENDVEGMAARMLELARRPELAATLGRAGRERVLARHTREHMLARVWDMIREVIDRPEAAGEADYASPAGALLETPR